MRANLKKEPDNHWLLTRLGLTYYEERAYGASLSYERRALNLAPHCPRAFWDDAGSLQKLGDSAWLHESTVASSLAVLTKSLGEIVVRTDAGHVS